VLVAGGEDSHSGWLDSAEIYDPASGHWTYTGRMNVLIRFVKWSSLSNLEEQTPLAFRLLIMRISSWAMAKAGGGTRRRSQLRICHTTGWHNNWLLLLP
jgi:hypothetical protein